MAAYEKNSYTLDNPISMNKLKKLFTNEDIDKMRELSKMFHRINCNAALRENDMVLFFKNIIPILPKSFGTLYSLRGRNPNEIDNSVLNENKPFVRIHGNWYMSKNLVREVRFIVPVSVPKKSLIDHSLKTKGINFENIEVD